MATTSTWCWSPRQGAGSKVAVHKEHTMQITFKHNHTVLFTKDITTRDQWKRSFAKARKAAGANALLAAIHPVGPDGVDRWAYDFPQAEKTPAQKTRAEQQEVADRAAMATERKVTKVLAQQKAEQEREHDTVVTRTLDTIGQMDADQMAALLDGLAGIFRENHEVLDNMDAPAVVLHLVKAAKLVAERTNN
jgi:hypothetical protein